MVVVMVLKNEARRFLPHDVYWKCNAGQDRGNTKIAALLIMSLWPSKEVLKYGSSAGALAVITAA